VAPGIYVLKPEYSGKFGDNALTVQGPVAEGSNRPMTEVRVHAGNHPQDTEGCYMPGNSLSFDRTGGSRNALAEIRSEMFAPGVTEREISYSNPVGVRWYVPGGTR
jgi:Family of unknown function (DUF5675)